MDARGVPEFDLAAGEVRAMLRKATSPMARVSMTAGQALALMEELDRRADLAPSAQPDESRADPKAFPVMYGRVARPGPTTIPWAMADRAYSVYSRLHGAGQSLERIAERGGFGALELDLFIPGWREELSEFRALEARHARVREAAEAMVKKLDIARASGLVPPGISAYYEDGLSALRAALEDK